MDEHVITIRWVDAPDEIAFHDFAQGTYNTFACGCGVPLADREAAARHAAEHGQCPMCLGAGTISITPHDTAGCDGCGGSGSTGGTEPRTVTVEARVTESFVREVAELLPDEFGLTDVVAVLEGRLRGGVETVLSVAAGLIRYLEVQGRIVLCRAPDYLPGEGVRQRYDDPRWIRVRRM
ncbi:hypothetical protein [Nonomuraea aridisoli]|uniref:Uncharacterized protein n=1 Tax=Nonomuraea aridisoli TaxID=2070368 RepID=A0A2W2F816_9ACTN|nr:hypothetical protein [Nonomuraea aridisoli]PZG11784.1 hypothetical protein C1J01_34280 [Nonomuraea aridisoli]